MLADFEQNTAGISAHNTAASRHLIASFIALAEHRTRTPRARHAQPMSARVRSVRFPVVANAFDLAGQRDSAIATYTRYLESPAVSNRAAIDQFFLASSFKRLGELLKLRENRNSAAHYYEEFVELWKNADAVLQPQVREVRERLARLSAAEASSEEAHHARPRVTKSVSLTVLVRWRAPGAVLR